MELQPMLLIAMAVVVLASFLSLLRVERDRALQCWSLGWVVLVTTALLSAGLGNPFTSQGPPLLVFAMLACATSLPFILLAGAYAWTQQPMPARATLLGVATSLVHAALGVTGQGLASALLIVPIEVAVVGLGALVLWRGRTHHERPLISVLLAGAYAVWAGGVEAFVGVVNAFGFETSAPYGMAANLALGMGTLQIVAVLSRIRDDERRAVRARERDLALLRAVARAGAMHDQQDSLAAGVLPPILKALELDCAGIWLFDAGRENLCCVGQIGMPRRLLESFEKMEATGPIREALVSTRDPILASAEGSSGWRMHPLTVAEGIRSSALLPLYWQDEALGMLGLSSMRRSRFEQTEVALFPALADELALAVHHVAHLQERADALQALARERQMLRAVLETAPMGILVCDAKHRIELMNRIGADHIGCGEPERWIGRGVSELAADLLPRVHEPESRREEAVRATLEGRPIEDLEMVFKAPHERILLFFSSHVYSSESELVGRVWCSRDVTEERRLGAQLQHSQKLETLGTLSGGIAHDFNNQLAVILGNTRHLQREFEQAHGLADTGLAQADLDESLEDLERAAEHCAQLTRSLLTFARRAPLAIQSLDTAQVMNGLRELLRPLMPSTIAIEIVMEEELPTVAADPIQLQQVLVNLAVNARDAMKEKGVLTLAVRRCQVGPERARAVAGGRPGAFVELSVADTGAGIDPDEMARIFEPFYTTKPVGKGTGLGLSIVHGVVTAHHGWVEVESRPGVGATFRVLLPVADAAQALVYSALPRRDAAGDETVLVADDEPGIRRLVRMGLEARGYRVIEAVDGEDALARWHEQRAEIKAVVLDLTMPGRDGLAVRSELLTHSPGLPVLITSGNLLDRPSEAVDFLAKPFQLAELAARLRSAIDRRPAG